MPLLTVDGVEKRYGADLVLNHVSFQIERGEHVALVGPNGSGKSTLLRILAGLVESDGGRVVLAGNAIVAYASQHARFESGHTLWDAMLEVFSDSIKAQCRMRELEGEMGDGRESGEISDEYRRLSSVVEHAGYDYESRIERVLTGLELERTQWNSPVAHLSGGQKTRANLARVLLREADLLLLDEPTNHLDIEAMEWLESYLKGQKRAFIVVAHDRYFLENVTGRTLELEAGTLEDYPVPYFDFLRLKEERRQRAQRVYEEQQQQIASTEEFVRRFRAGQRAKEARGRQKRLERVERVARPEAERTIKLRVDRARHKGDIALRLGRLSVGYSETTVLELPEEMVVPQGARVAIVGPNGSGKTTLARTIMGELPPRRGEAEWASRVKPAYYAQSSAGVFQPDATVLSAFLGRFPVGEEVARTYLGRFLFENEDVHRHVKDLSGGERSRLSLACLLYSHPNALVLDEPTNHLDIPGREALGDALQDFGGTLLLISHDRYLIDQLATEVWSVGQGQIEVYDGNWSDFVAGRNRRRLVYADPRNLPEDGRQVPPAAPGMSSIRAEIDDIHAKVDPLLSRIEAMSRVASGEQLDALIAEYGDLQSRLRDLTFELIASRTS